MEVQSPKRLQGAKSKKETKEREKKRSKHIKVDTLSGSALVSKDSPSCDQSDFILGTRQHIGLRIIASLS